MQLNQYQANELLFRLLDNDIRDDDYDKLRSWLDSGPAARAYYCTFMTDYSALSMRATSDFMANDRVSAADEALIADFWTLMSEQENTAPALELPESKQQPSRELICNVQRQPVVRKVNKAAVFVAAASFLALIAMLLFARFAPPVPSQVATIIDSIDARWSADINPEAGLRLSSPSKPIRLTQGIVKLVTDENVQVVLEAPTEFHFVSYSEISLSYGKLFAYVSEQGSGFSVATPNSKVVDLGTKFGVVCDLAGNTEVHMYEGKANLFAGQKSENKISEFLLAGSAKKVSYHDSVAREITLEQDVVIRNIDSKQDFIWHGQSVNLADIVGGGNGFGKGTVDKGVDVSTGQFVQRLATTDSYRGPEGYVRVSGSPYIDGVFVPGIDEISTQVTSTGIKTDEVPHSDGEIWGYISNGAWHYSEEVPRHNLRIDGRELDGRQNPAIMMHTNLGITFDLTEIRRRLPGVCIKSFSSAIGVSETVNSWLKSRDFSDFEPKPGVLALTEKRESAVEFWVFLDGEKALHRKLTSVSGADQVEIPIGQNVRFLTLAVSEADDSYMFDWAAFAWPELKLDLAGQTDTE